MQRIASSPVARVRLLLAGVFLAAGCATAPERAPQRVATFERTPVIVAFYQGAQHAASLQQLRAEHAEAKARGDLAAVEACERRGAQSQELAHRQLAGEAPLDNVLAVLAPQLAEVAAAVGATAVAERGAEPPGATTVDVTARLVSLLPPAR
jgi:hypothetical protein